MFRVTFKIPEVEEDDLDDHDCQGGRWPTPGGLDSRRRTGKIKDSIFLEKCQFFSSILVGQKYCGLSKSSQASVQDFDSYQSHQVFDRVQ